MAINNLPAAIQAAIQTGALEHEFAQPLHATIGFRAIADREPFAAGIGESVTKTRRGLLPAVTTPLAPAANTDLTSGITPSQYGVEQYTLTVNQYAADMMLNTATSRVAIADLYLENAKALAEQAARSVDTIAALALFSAYTQGNTRVRTTLGSAGATVAVDDVRGFAAGQTVIFNGSNTYTVASVAVDGSNVGTNYLATSGTITFTSSVTVADGTAGNSVVSTVAPAIMRPGNVRATTALTSSSLLTMQSILAAKASLEANNVPKVDGSYVMYADPIHLTGLYQDPAFQQFFRGQISSKEYRKGVVAEMLGVQVVETNLNPVQFVTGIGNVRRSIVCGQGALVEGTFTPTAYARSAGELGSDVVVVDGIAHVTREPIDALKQVVTQAWSYIGGFVAPTDALTTPSVLPTATNAAFKRAVVLESV